MTPDRFQQILNGVRRATQPIAAVDHTARGGYVPEPTTTLSDRALKALDETGARLKEIHEMGYAPRRLEQLEAELFATLDEQLAQDAASDQEDLGAKYQPQVSEAIGSARGDNRSRPVTTDHRLDALLEETREARRATTAAMDLALLQQLDDPSAIAAIADGALVSEHDASIRRLLPAALHRLAARERADSAARANDPGYLSPATPVRQRLEAAFAAWADDHPAPAARIAALERAQRIDRERLESGYRLIREQLNMTKVARLTRRAPASGGSVDDVRQRFRG